MPNPPPQQSQRIASLLSSATEILFALGLGEQVVGVSHECDWPPEAALLPKLTRSYVDSHHSSLAIDEQVKQNLAAGMPLYGVDAECLLKLQPTLIVTQAQCDVCAVRYTDVLDIVSTFPSTKQPQVLALQHGSLNEILQDVVRVGEAAGVIATAQLYQQSLQARIAAISAKTITFNASQRPRVACIEWVEPLMLAANWTPELIHLAGGESLLARSGEHSAYHAWENLVASDPEVIVVAPCGFHLERSWQETLTLTNRPQWNELTAVKQQRVYVIDGNAYLNRSGPRIVDTLEILAHILHPQCFPPPQHGGWRHFAA